MLSRFSSVLTIRESGAYGPILMLKQNRPFVPWNFRHLKPGLIANLTLERWNERSEFRSAREDGIFSVTVRDGRERTGFRSWLRIFLSRDERRVSDSIPIQYRT